MAMKRYSALSKAPELEPQHQMQLSVISKTTLFGGSGGGVLPYFRGYSQYILSSTGRTSNTLINFVNLSVTFISTIVNSVVLSMEPE